MASQRFAISFAKGLLPLLVPLGMGPRRSDVVVGDGELRVRLGIGFRARFSTSAVREVGSYDGPVLGWGVHGWRGRWLVNGSSRGLVALELEPLQRAYVLGVPVKLGRLNVSLEDPEGFIALLQA